MAQLQGMGTMVYKADENESDNDDKDGDDARKSYDPKKKQEQYQKTIETTATTIGAMATSKDLTINGIKNLQQLVNNVTGTTYEIINLGEHKIVKGFTVDALGRRMAILGVLLSAADIANNGLSWKNGTDAVMGGVAMIPGIGWVLGAAYFLADPIVKSTTGKGIGEHLGDATNMTSNVISATWNTLVSGLSNLESQLRRGWLW